MMDSMLLMVRLYCHPRSVRLLLQLHLLLHKEDKKLREIYGRNKHYLIFLTSSSKNHMMILKFHREEEMMTRQH
jgi:hypothetical protein